MLTIVNNKNGADLTWGRFDWADLTWGRFDLGPIWLGPIWLRADLTLGRFGLGQIWPASLCLTQVLFNKRRMQVKCISLFNLTRLCSFHSRVDNVINDSFNYAVTRHRWNCQELSSALIHVLAHFQRTCFQFTFVLVLTYYVNRK